MLATCHRVRNSACSQLSPAHSAHHCHSSFPPPGVAPSPSRRGGRAATTASTTPTASASASASAATSSGSAATFEQGASTSHCDHRGADYCAHRRPNISLYDPFRQVGDKRDAERQHDAGETQQQRACYAVEGANEVAAVEYRVYGVHVDRGHQRSEDRVQQAPGVKNHQIHQILSCHHSKAKRRIQRQHEWSDHIED